jgi:hypothetical protein
MTEFDKKARTREWREFYRELKAIAEPSERRLIEFEKAAIEFSKILVTMLYAINAGGLIGLPSIASLSGLSLQPTERVWLLKTSAAFFGTGLLLAGLCALLVHLNYRSHADATQFGIDEEIYRHCKLTDIYEGNNQIIEAAHAQREKDKPVLNRWISWTYRGSYVAGVGSLGLFLSGCWWIGSRIV